MLECRMRAGAVAMCVVVVAGCLAGCPEGGGGAALGPPAKVGFLTPPGTTPQDAVINPGAGVRVAVQDAAGSTVPSSVTVTVALGSTGTGPGGGALAGTVTVTAANGIATFTDLAISALGTGYTLVATATALAGATSPSFDVGAIPAKDGLGHLDAGVMNFTRAGANDAPNDFGLSGVLSVAVDAVRHRLFVADTSNHRVLVFNLSTANDLGGQDRIADFVLGQADFKSGQNGLAQNRLLSPVGLAYDPTNDRLFVSDQGNSRVLAFSTVTITNGMNASHVLGQTAFNQGGQATSQSRLRFPRGLALDTAGQRLFVADEFNNRVLAFGVSPTAIANANATGVLGQPNFDTMDIGPVTATRTVQPRAVAYDPGGKRLFVADGGGGTQRNRVLVFDVDAIAGGEGAVNVLGRSDFTTSGSTSASATTLNDPFGLAWDGATNRLFVSDNNFSRVLAFDVGVGFNDGQAADNVIGQTDFTAQVEATTRSGLRNPRDIAIAGDLLFVTDGSNRVVFYDVTPLSDGPDALDGLGQLDAAGAMDFTRLDPDGGPTAATFADAGAVALDPVRHRLFVADLSNNRVLVFNLSAANDFTGVDRVADFVLGQADFRTSVTPATVTGTGLENPNGIAYDPVRDRLFVSDSDNARVLVFDTAAIANGEAAAFVLGQAAFTTSSSGLSATELDDPRGLAYDPVGDRLFVADNQNARVLVFSTQALANGASATAVIGQPDFTSNTGAVTATRTSRPSDVAYEAAGKRLFVVDETLHRVLVFDLSAGVTNSMAAANVLGQTDFVSSSSGSTPAKLNDPVGIAHDAGRQLLYVTENNNSRVLIFRVATISSNGMAAASVLGQTDLVSTSQGTSATLVDGPAGVDVDPASGRVFIMDPSPHRLLVFEVP